MAAFELWNMRSRNLVGSYETEEAAFASVRNALGRHGFSYADSLFLGYEDDRGQSMEIAKGVELARRALAAAPAGDRQ